MAFPFGGSSASHNQPGVITIDSDDSETEIDTNDDGVRRLTQDVNKSPDTSPGTSPTEAITPSNPAPPAPQVARPHTNIFSEALRAGFQSVFGGQVDRTASFFAFTQPPPARPSNTAHSVNETAEVLDHSKRRKAFDPYDEDLLHSSDLTELEFKRRKIDKADKWHRRESSQLHRAQKPGAAAPEPPAPKAPTVTANDGQRPEPMEIPALGRGESVASHQTGRVRANSHSRVGTQKRTETPAVFDQLMNPARNTQPTDAPHQKTSAAMDRRNKTPSRPWERGTASSTSSHSISRGLHNGKHRLPHSSKRVRRSQPPPLPPTAKAPSRTSAAPLPHELIDLSLDDDEGLHGFIGAGADRRPDQRPKYTYAEQTTLDRQRELERKAEQLRKQRKRGDLKTGDKHVVPQHQQRPRDMPPVDTTRLLKAKETLVWEQAQAQGTRDDSTHEPGPPSPTPEASIDTRQKPVPGPVTVQKNRSKAPVVFEQRHSGQASAAHHRLPQRRPPTADYLRRRDEEVDRVPVGNRQPQLPRPSIQSAAPQLGLPHAPQKAPPLSPETIEQAAAQMRRIQSRRDVPRPPVIIADNLPPGFGERAHPEIRHARQRQLREMAQLEKEGREEQQDLDFAARYEKYKKGLPGKVRRELLGRDPDAGDEVVKEFVEQESKRRIEIYVRNEEARRSKKQHNFNKGTLRSVLEEVADDQSQNEPYDGQQGNQAAQPKANRVPASVALDSREFYKYVVYLSEPHRRSDEHLVFKSTKDFGRLDDAHSYLNDVLLDRKPPNASRKSKMEQEFDSLHFARFDDGLPWGEKKLRGGSASGKWITAYVQQVKQMRGNLEPDTLRNMYADKEMVDKFTPLVYQVTLVRIYPKMFKEAEEKREYLRQRRERKFKRQQEKFEKAAARQALDPVNEAEESAEQPAAAEMDEAGEGGRPGLTGEDVREKLADGGWSGGGPNSEDDASLNIFG